MRSHMVFTKKIPPNPIVKFQGVPLRVTPSFVLSIIREVATEGIAITDCISQLPLYNCEIRWGKITWREPTGQDYHYCQSTISVELGDKLWLAISNRYFTNLREYEGVCLPRQSTYDIIRLLPCR